jgi:hypothetical protein
LPKQNNGVQHGVSPMQAEEYILIVPVAYQL